MKKVIFLTKKLNLKKVLKLFTLIILASFLFVFLIFNLMLWISGREIYYKRAMQINAAVSVYPDFFSTVFNDIFPFALSCDSYQETSDQESCVSQTRDKFDTLSAGLEQKHQNTPYWNRYGLFKPSNYQPMYFIKLLPDGDIAKLFFSGDLKIEKVDTREERMVRDLLQEKRDSLYGLYFSEEVLGYDQVNNERHFYDLKPRYLKDLYSKFEVIVPYYQRKGVYYSDRELIGAIVWLHGD